jgi:predicted DNA binding protein
MSDGPAFSSVTEPPPAENFQVEQRDLWATLKIKVGEECALTRIEADIKNVNLQQINGECKATVVTDDDDMNVTQICQSMDEDCISYLFYEHGCVPHVVDAKNDSLVITVHPEKRETLPQLVSALMDQGYVVDVQRLVGVGNDLIEESTVLCDLSILTEKQRDAISLAIERGYYDRSADADMGSMAGELDISKSAFSRRLKAAEAKLMLELMADRDDHE